MGEKSKLIGEYGEKSVENFLKMIGWGKAHQNIEFRCSDESHGKRTHGLDFFFTYKSPLVDNVLKKINISVKFSDLPYPTSPTSLFKKHFDDIIKALDCFKKSQESKDIISGIRNYNKSENIGLLFWLTNDEDSYIDLIPKLANVRFSENYYYDSFYIVDNKKIDFLYSCLKYSKTKFEDSEISFFYPDTGKNIIPSIKTNYGKVLPIEYINASILPLRIEGKLTKKITLALYTVDNFNVEDLKRLISLAKELSKSWTSEVLILFPNYNETRHSSFVRIAKGVFEEESFTDLVKVESYNDDFKSLQI